MGTFSLTRTARLSKRGAAAWLGVLALAGLVCGGASTARASATVSAASWADAGVPWHSVGPGWILADVAKSQSSSGRGTLYLVSPGGQRYRLGPAPANASLEDWSGNGANALFFNQNLTTPTVPIIVVNLHTGRVSSFMVQSQSYPGLEFSRPEGKRSCSSQARRPAARSCRWSDSA